MGRASPPTLRSNPQPLSAFPHSARTRGRQGLPSRKGPARGKRRWACAGLTSVDSETQLSLGQLKAETGHCPLRREAQLHSGPCDPPALWSPLTPLLPDLPLRMSPSTMPRAPRAGVKASLPSQAPQAVWGRGSTSGHGAPTGAGRVLGGLTQPLSQPCPERGRLQFLGPSSRSSHRQSKSSPGHSEDIWN